VGRGLGRASLARPGPAGCCGRAAPVEVAARRGGRLRGRQERLGRGGGGGGRGGGGEGEGGGRGAGGSPRLLGPGRRSEWGAGVAREGQAAQQGRWGPGCCRA
jgi:hypothetical protein